MSFSGLIGNEHNKQILQRFLRRKNLGMTLIFAGPEGIGKRQFALTLAKVANCQNLPETNDDSCDICPTCQRIQAGTYSDVVTIQPDGTYIKIAQTRELINDVQVRPREGRQRFFLIDEADRLREEAANSLLKTLEEPPATSTIILLTARPDSLLSTIRSRAQKLNFAPLPTPEMEKYLASRFQLATPDARLLALLTGGRIGQATTIDLTEYRRERRELLELMDLLATGNNKHRLLKAAEHYGKQERDAYERMILLFLNLLRDIFLIAASGSIENIVNIDVADRLSLLAEKIGIAQLTKWIKKFDELRFNLRININRQIATESAFIGLAN
ncbi:MAG: DNA polymerase III subunit delta' [Acidobacteria bacterium]|nr:DNA polymerase III subunit delta' [Acidobacteriota bacterium]